MSNIKNKVALAALAIFAAHEKIEKIYMTSDGQGFTEEEKAKDNARYHKDQSVTPFERGFEESYQETDEAETAKDKDPGDREALFAEYKELYGKSANHMTGAKKLKEAIDAKKAELAKSAQNQLPAVDEVKKDEEGNSDLGTSEGGNEDEDGSKESGTVQE